MKIAVVTPTLPGRESLLNECRESVKNQVVSVPVFHAVGVDYNKEGSALTRNKIVKGLPSEYDWIAFLDDDDLFLPEHLQTLLNEAGDADVIYPSLQTVGFTWANYFVRDFDPDRLRRENFIPVTVLMRRSLFDRVGGFKNCWVEDHDLWVRCLDAGARFKFVPKATWQYRQPEGFIRKTTSGGDVNALHPARTLIAINSWSKGAVNGENQAMRDTFLKEVPNYPGLEYRFFIGDGTPSKEDETALWKSYTKYEIIAYGRKANESKKWSVPFTPKDDEVLLHVMDDYSHVAYKTREGHRWGVERGFSWIFQCCPDTYIDLPKLMASDYRDHSYIGSDGKYKGGTASGGCGYWLDNRASRIVMNSPVTDWAEDRWVGNIMMKNGIPFHSDPRYWSDYPLHPTIDNDLITSHLCITPNAYDPNLMRKLYANRFTATASKTAVVIPAPVGHATKVVHAHKGYCRAHKQLGCIPCSKNEGVRY
jgi:glycosyltransferase involved in cell wall biosynthesis